jgi:hypothetical protein
MAGKISGFIIALVLVGLFSGVFALYFSEIASKYGVTTYNNASFDAYNKLATLNNLSENIKEDTTEMQSKSGVVDIVGDFFNNAYNVVKLLLTSVDAGTSIMNQAANDAQLGTSTSLFKTAGIIILIIILCLAAISLVIAKAGDEI